VSCRASALAERGDAAEGFSIPAQREACTRKAAALGAVIAEEFVDRGESATSARRPELRRLLAYVKEYPVSYVVVHKIDRLARNRVDDVSINLAIKAAGAQLVSVTENIDETPSGKLMHTILSGMAEFYSGNLALEVLKGLTQKAKAGGTPGKAPLGYLNVRRMENGAEVRTVEVDSDRGPLVAWAFEAYATGEWTQAALLEELASRGLDVPAARKTPARPLSLSYVQHMLTNPYYRGIVRYQGVEYEGRHEPLISSHVWWQGQEVLAAKREFRKKERKHPHYLKGIACGYCGSQMIVTNAKSRSGRIYPYFVCIGRHQKRTDCTMKAILIPRVEELVEEHYRTVRLSPDLRETVEDRLRQDLAAHYEAAGAQRGRLERRREKLLRERAKLLEAHYAEAVPLDLLRQEQKRIAAELGPIDESLARTNDHRALVEANLERALAFAQDCSQAYLTATPFVRRLFNQTFFKKLYVEDEDSVRSELAPPFDTLLNGDRRGDGRREVFHKDTPKESPLEGVRRSWDSVVLGLKEPALVGRAGIEPATLGLKVPCSTN
jgi:site-specific DNA recombinase